MKTILSLVVVAFFVSKMSCQVDFTYCEIDEIEATQGTTYGDLNNDGALDLVSCGILADQVRIYIRDTEQEDWIREVVLNVKGPRHIEIADIDQDGNNDIVILQNDNDTLFILENDGNSSPNFVVHTYTYGINLPKSLTIEDINGDGYPDLVLGYTSRLVHLENLTQFVFRRNSLFDPEIGVPGEIDIADINNDGYLDIVSAEFSGPIVVYFNSGNSLTFTDSIIGDLANPTSVQAVDIDEDSRIDLVINSFNSGLVSYLNKDTHFEFFPIDPSIRFGNGVEVVDIDDDMDLDIICTEFSTDNLYYYENAENQYTQRLISGIGLTGDNLKATDLDYDGDMDIIVTGALIGKFVVLKNNKITSSIREYSSDVFQVYPNPTNSYLSISSVDPIESITLYSPSGNVIKSFSDNLIDLSSLPASNYVLWIKTKDNIGIKKILKY